MRLQGTFAAPAPGKQLPEGFAFSPEGTPGSAKRQPALLSLRVPSAHRSYCGPVHLQGFQKQFFLLLNPRACSASPVISAAASVRGTQVPCSQSLQKMERERKTTPNNKNNN